MKTSYHYFTFIIISLLLHYLFFYFTQTKTPEQNIEQLSVSLSAPQQATFQSNNTPTMEIDHSNIPAGHSKPNVIKADFHSPEQSGNLPLINQQPANIKIETRHRENITEIENNSVKPIQLALAENPVEQDRKISTPVATTSLTTEAIVEASTIEPSTTEFAPKESSSDKLTNTEQLEIIENKKVIVKNSLAKPTNNQDKEKLSTQLYLVNIDTHKADDAALLKAELFEQEIVNLPELPKQKQVRKTTSSQPVTVSKKTATVVTTVAKTLKTTSPRNSDKASVTRKTTKPTFKPKVDKSLLTLSETRQLPEAVAISGKKPDYPAVAAKLNQKGQVVASMTVLPTGSTKETEILKSSGSKELDEAVIEFIAQERFMPSLQGQDKVSSKQIFSFSYK
ncbi:hypothetical protein DS885_10140 [Psychromonas sp. B3M02]|uniref:energy transducer TonB n=1 Tax=Psychromonas sp. B3M02 TaxID=2267226 RepID=UPI000DEA0B66|nr:energy transducer TonB [Psychromonas sp. B3M02]RBW45129.1 hypothetical protein DS885_10140 [Psychromonas sp. B3M02]